MTSAAIESHLSSARVLEFGTSTERESLGWRTIERRGRCDFSGALTHAAAAQSRGVQVIWTLCQQGWPDDVDPLSSAFAPRFARYAAHAARFLREYSDGAPLYVPINEPSEISWAACGSQLREPKAGANERRQALRRQLALAAMQACEAILVEDPRARFVHTEAMVCLVPPAFEDQFYYWDLIAGNAGSGQGVGVRPVDFLGVNYYSANQADSALSTLLLAVHGRYGRPILLFPCTGKSSLPRPRA